MQAIALHPPRGQVMGMLLGAGALVAVMAVVPLTALPISFLLPLFVCPLVGTPKQWAAIPVAVAPALVALLGGQPALYSLSLLFSCGAPVAAAALLRPSKSATAEAYAYFLSAYAFGMVMVLLGLRSLFPGELAAGIASGAAGWVEASPDGNLTLYRLTAAGFLPLPDRYGALGALSFILDPGLSRQLLLSFQLRLTQLLRELLPMLTVQVCWLGGVLTALRVQRLNHAYLLVDERHKEKVRLAVTPGFSMLRLPKAAHGALTAMALAGLCLFMVDSPWARQLALLLYTAFTAIYALAGAAALTGMLTAKKPSFKTAFGLLAAALYLLCPIALFMMGILDPLFNFRSGKPLQSKEEDDE